MDRQRKHGGHKNKISRFCFCAFKNPWILALTVIFSVSYCNNLNQDTIQDLLKDAITKKGIFASVDVDSGRYFSVTEDSSSAISYVGKIDLVSRTTDKKEVYKTFLEKNIRMIAGKVGYLDAPADDVVSDANTMDASNPTDQDAITKLAKESAGLLSKDKKLIDVFNNPTHMGVFDMKGEFEGYYSVVLFKEDMSLVYVLTVPKEGGGLKSSGIMRYPEGTFELNPDSLFEKYQVRFDETAKQLIFSTESPTELYSKAATNKDYDVRWFRSDSPRSIKVMYNMNLKLKLEQLNEFVPDSTLLTQRLNADGEDSVKPIKAFPEVKPLDIVTGKEEVDPDEPTEEPIDEVKLTIEIDDVEFEQYKAYSLEFPDDIVAIKVHADADVYSIKGSQNASADRLFVINEVVDKINQLMGEKVLSVPENMTLKGASENYKLYRPTSHSVSRFAFLKPEGSWKEFLDKVKNSYIRILKSKEATPRYVAELFDIEADNSFKVIEQWKIPQSLIEMEAGKEQVLAIKGLSDNKGFAGWIRMYVFAQLTNWNHDRTAPKDGEDNWRFGGTTFFIMTKPAVEGVEQLFREGTDEYNAIFNIDFESTNKQSVLDSLVNYLALLDVKFTELELEETQIKELNKNW